jgi:hypothetical protein
MTGVVTSVEGTLMCSLCGCEWSEHAPHAGGEVSPLAGCVQALGRRLAEIDVRTAGMDPLYGPARRGGP